MGARRLDALLALALLGRLRRGRGGGRRVPLPGPGRRVPLPGRGRRVPLLPGPGWRPAADRGRCGPRARASASVSSPGRVRARARVRVPPTAGRCPRGGRAAAVRRAAAPRPGPVHGRPPWSSAGRSSRRGRSRLSRSALYRPPAFSGAVRAAAPRTTAPRPGPVHGRPPWSIAGRSSRRGRSRLSRSALYRPPAFSGAVWAAAPRTTAPRPGPVHGRPPWSSVGAAIARSVEASRTVAAAAALAHSEEVKRLSSFGAAIARSVEASKFLAISDSVVRMGEAYRNSIASTLKASSELRMGVQIVPLRSSSMFDESDARFSRLSHLSHVVHSEEPFSPTVGMLLENEFGDISTPDLSDNADERDEAAMRAGLNPELIAFPRATYLRVLFNAGFRLSFASVPVPQAIEEPDAGAAFNSHHWQILNELEQRLRQVVEQRLKNLSGSNWTRQRVPQTVRERWLARQQEDRADGRSVYADIQYADFMDLADVITRRDNWREAFQSVFEDPNDITVSLRRLHPVRKALAHSRPLGRADVLTLVSEATRIFRALGMRVLH